MTREYAFHATEETMAALRRLRAAWAGWAASADRVTVRLIDGTVYHVAVEWAEMEPALEALRIAAAPAAADAVATPVVVAGESEHAAGGFAAGGNDVVLFHGATWTVRGTDAAGAAEGQTLVFSGRLGLQPDDAEAVAVTTDAVVFATTTGEGLLVRLGARPRSLEVTTDREEIGRFLVLRGYGE